MKDELERIKPELDVDALRSRSPSEETMGDILPESSFQACYDTVMDESVTCFSLLNEEGDTDIYVLFSDIDEFEQSTEEKVYFDFQTHQDRLITVLWTVHHPEEPLGFPVTFNIQTSDHDRYKAIRLVEQEQIWVHYLAITEERRLLHIFSEAVAWPEEDKPLLEEKILSCYTIGENEARPTENVDTKSAMDLTDADIQQRGTVYHIDYGQLVSKHGEEGARVEAMELISRAFLVVQRHPLSDVREARMLFWAGQGSSVLSLFLTPELTHWFPHVEMDKEEENPFSRFLMGLSEYQRSDSASPLEQGAMPLMEYDRGQLVSLELNETFLQRMKALYARAYGGDDNPYDQE